MSSINLERYQARHPSERQALARLADILDSGQKRFYTLSQIAEAVHANSQDELALALGEMASAGLLDYEFEIRSPQTNRPIKAFRRLADIPKVVHDVSTDTEVPVSLEDVWTVYALPGKVAR